MKNISIIGSGSWGIALAIHLAKMGNKVKVWSFAKEEADLINNEKKCKFLPEVNLPEGITCFTNIEESLKDTDVILHVTPSKFVRNIIKQYKQYIKNQPVIMCSKGFEAGTLKTLSQLVTRGLVEIKRLGLAMGGDINTFYGLSGLGDLIVTCLSEHSRNRRAGRLIGRGLSVEEAKKEIGMTIESIDNIEVAYELSKKYNVEMPIVNAVYDVLYNNLKPQKAVEMLMTREKKCE